MRRTTITAALVAGAALLAAPLAIAAPTAGPVDASIARVQDEGGRMVVKEASSGNDSCSVTSVQPLRVSELPRIGQAGPSAVPLSPVVHVGVQC